MAAPIAPLPAIDRRYRNTRAKGIASAVYGAYLLGFTIVFTHRLRYADHVALIIFGALALVGGIIFAGSVAQHERQLLVATINRDHLYVSPVPAEPDSTNALPPGISLSATVRHNLLFVGLLILFLIVRVLGSDDNSIDVDILHLLSGQGLTFFQLWRDASLLSIVYFFGTPFLQMLGISNLQRCMLDDRGLTISRFWKRQQFIPWGELRGIVRNESGNVKLSIQSWTFVGQETIIAFRLRAIPLFQAVVIDGIKTKDTEPYIRTLLATITTRSNLSIYAYAPSPRKAKQASMVAEG